MSPGFIYFILGCIGLFVVAWVLAMLFYASNLIG